MSQGREVVVKRGPGRPPRHSYVPFAFKTGDLVLVKWNDGMVYFAKIKRTDHKRQKCVVVFDDKSQDEAHFTQIHSVDETTTDIICIKCKKDDSDKPNEIVLCDTCGIGFHQKCHLPNIPASALELDTPWNCSYCQKGVKCPFLTESLDVLQNLLSDDECSGAEDIDSAAAFDSDHFEPNVVEEVPRVTPRKRRGRKPATEATVAMKRERRKVHHAHNTVTPRQSSSIVTMDTSGTRLLSEGWKPKSSYEDGDSEPVYISSGKSTPEPPPPPPPPPTTQVGVKRKRHHHSTLPTSGGHVKKQKRSSVESRTVSVTRVSMPVYDNSSAEEMDTSRDSSVCDSSVSSSHGLGSIKEEESVVHEKRPRTLRVSLSIPDEVEPGTPFDKVVKAHHQRVNSPHLASTETKELPSWENFANSNVLHRSSSPKQRPQTLATEKSVILSSKSSTPAAKSVPEASSKSAPSAFLASPLPIISSPKLSHPPGSETPSVPEAKINVKATSTSSSSGISTSLDVGVKGPSSLSDSSTGPPAAVGYSAPTPVPGPDVVIVNRPSALVVKSAQPEVNKLTPSSHPPQRSPHPPSQPQAPPANLFKPTSSTAVSLGITQPSTNLTLSSTTKPSALATGTGAAPNPPLGVPVPNPSSGMPVTGQPQQQSVLATAVPPTSTPHPPTSAQHVIVAQQQQKQQIPGSTSNPAKQVIMTPSTQQVPSVPAHQSLAVPAAQSPNTARQQNLIVVASSRPPSSIPAQQPVVMNSTRPPSAPMQQQVLSRPPGVSAAVCQQQQIYVASTRPATIAGQQQVVVSAARPSSVPIQQHRPHSVPTQQQTVVVAPPRPSSVPTQQVLLSHSQSQTPNTPTQHFLVTHAQSPAGGAPVQQVMVRQPPPYVEKGQSAQTVYQTFASTPTSVLTHSSPTNVQYSSPAMMQAQRQIQEQSVTAVKKPAVQSSGDADVIITGVESTNRVIQGPNVGYDRAAVTGGGGERLVIMNSSGEAIPYQTTVMSTPMGPGAVRKVIAKPVDVGQMVLAGSTIATTLPAVSGQSFVQSTVGSQVSPASMLPVVITPTNSAQLPLSSVDRITSPMVYRMATDSHAQTQTQLVGAQVARGTHVRTPPLKSNVASTRAAQPSAGQSATSVIVACVPGTVSGQAVTFSGVSTTKPYAIVNAMPGTQISATTLPLPPKTYSLVSEKQSSGNKLQHHEVVQTISKKIGDAFDSGNEQLLVAAFEDAWKRFQANGKQYEPGAHVVSMSGTKILGKDPPPPNAEVFAVPGTTSRVNLVRQTSASRVLTPNTSSPLPVQQMIAPPPLSSNEQTSYVYTAANAAQPKVYLQPVTVNSGQQSQPQSHSKVHSSGLFYPPSSAENTTVLHKKSSGTGVQRVVVSQNSPVVRYAAANSDAQTSQATGHRRRRSSKSKFCARCGKSATYLCSGCHTEWYCGRECQLKAWDAHAEHCKA